MLLLKLKYFSKLELKQSRLQLFLHNVYVLNLGSSAFDQSLCAAYSVKL